jgi:hypothetical protein
VPLLRVLVDGIQVAAVSTDALDVLTVNVSGAKTDEEFCHLEVSGGRYPLEGQSTHLIWLNELVVRPGQCVRVEMAASGPTSHPGKTIEELFPDGVEEPEGPFLSAEAVLDNLALRPQVRTRYQFLVETSSGQKCTAEIAGEEHGFGASFLWNSSRPDRVSASLHTYSLQQLRLRSGFIYHWREHLNASGWAEVTVEA